MSGDFLLIYIYNFHVINHFLLIYIYNFHLNLDLDVQHPEMSIGLDKIPSQQILLVQKLNLKDVQFGLVQKSVFDILTKCISALKGKLLLSYMCNFHVLNHLLLIYIFELHWKF